MCAAFDPPEKAVPPAHEEPFVSEPASSDAPEGGQLPARRVPLVPGQRWQAYQVGDPLVVESGWCFHAVNAGMLDDVLIRVEPLGEQSPMRAQAWSELLSLDHPGLIGGIEAYEENGYRYEVSRPPPPSTLREWASCRQAGLEDVRTLVRQLAAVITALHDRGVVHLNLRPDTIHLGSAEAGLHVTLGGLECATVYNQAELVPAAVDPFYAPPEAAGLTKHAPGAGLRAWDWWSLGRVMQELVLGRHVLGLVINRDVSRLTPELRSRAEALLLERDPKAPRAGAVELMPAMDRALNDLLRGLLSSSRDGRWGADEVQRWLAQQPVKDRYQLGRNEQLFPWKDRMFTVVEAAEYFVREENWTDGLTNIFAVDDRAALVHFVGEHPDQQPVRKQIEALHEFVNVPTWAGHPLEVRRSAAAAAAWLFLGGEGTRLVLQGRPVDAACLRWLLGQGNVAESVALVHAMMAVPFVEMIEKADPAAARFLAALATVNEEASLFATKHGWLEAANAPDQARLLLLALAPPAKLAELGRTLRAQYACTRDAELQEIFAKPAPSTGEQVLLAYTAEQPERFKYVSHTQWNAERYAALRTAGERLADGLFWLRIERALRAGPLVFGHWSVVLGIWLPLAATLMLFAPAGIGAGRALALIAAVAAVRLGATAAQRFVAGRRVSETRSWLLDSPLIWCRREASAVLGAEVSLGARKAAARFVAVNNEIAALEIVPRPALVTPPKLAWLTWSGTVAGWLLLVSAIGLGGWWEWNFFKTTARPDAPEAAPGVVRHDPAAGAVEAAAEQLTPEEFFFGDPQKPLKLWNAAEPAAAPTLQIVKQRSASSDQIASALVEGQKLLLPYARLSVDTLIAVPVDTEDNPGLLIYDGRSRKLLQRKVLFPEQLPETNTWFSLDNLKILYLGELPVENLTPAVSVPSPLSEADRPEREIRPEHRVEGSARAQ